MEKFIGQDYQNLKEREQFIKDNAEGVENMGYSKPLNSAVIDKLKEELADATIQKNDVEQEKKMANSDYNARIKFLKECIGETADKLKSKSEYVNEPCYKLVDEQERVVGYYNKEGMLVYERPARLDELQPKLFKVNAAKHIDKTGTDG